VNEIRRLNDLERKQQFVLSQAEKCEIRIRPGDPLAPYARTRSQPEIDQLSSNLNDLQRRLQDMNTSQERLNKRYLELTERRHVLRETAVFFQVAESRADEITGANYQEDASFLGGMQRDSMDPHSVGGATISIGFVAGVIPRARIAIFERVLFRALRGNLFMNNAEIQETIIDPSTDTPVFKNVFIVFAHGRELINKIKKICESMGATLYQVDEHPDRRRESALEVMAHIEDLRHVLENTKKTRKDELVQIVDHIHQYGVLLLQRKGCISCNEQNEL
jgi:V-type H+-transporting ATPase subunit a